MSKLKNIFLATFVSPEVLVGLAVVLLYVFVPEFLAELGSKLQSDSEIWKYAPTLTLLFSGAAFRYSSKIRAPMDNSPNTALYEWPLYPLLVARVMVSLWFAVLCGVAGIALWIFGKSMSYKMVGGVFLSATGISATTAFTMLLAHQKLRELLERFGI